MQDVLADGFDEVSPLLSALENLISTSPQHREVVAKHLQGVLLSNHLEPRSGKLDVYTYSPLHIKINNPNYRVIHNCVHEYSFLVYGAKPSSLLALLVHGIKQRGGSSSID